MNSKLEALLAHFDPTKEQEGFREAETSTGRRYYLFEREIQRSPCDEWLYRLLRLENGLEVLLVSDKSLDKAAAALTVSKGTYNDPGAPSSAPFIFAPSLLVSE